MPTSKQSTLSFVIPVYNDQESVNRTIVRLANLCGDWPVEIIVVDDGSKLPIEITLPNPPKLGVKLLRHFPNKGRAEARNFGAMSAQGDYLTFLDADCAPVSGYIDGLFEYVQQGYDLFSGHLKFKNKDIFFEKFENTNQVNRMRAQSDWAIQWTSANLTVKKELFVTVGGFSKEFTGYGFEDRDLLLRLAEVVNDEKIGYNLAATVCHEDDVDLKGYNRKFYKSGTDSARVFRRLHPKAYNQMHYSFFDANHNKLLRFIPKLLLTGVATLGRDTLSYIFLKLNDNSKAKPVIFKLTKGLSYLLGTTEQKDG